MFVIESLLLHSYQYRDHLGHNQYLKPPATSHTWPSQLAVGWMSHLILIIFLFLRFPLLTFPLLLIFLLLLISLTKCLNPRFRRYKNTTHQAAVDGKIFDCGNISHCACGKYLTWRSYWWERRIQLRSTQARSTITTVLSIIMGDFSPLISYIERRDMR